MVIKLSNDVFQHSYKGINQPFARLTITNPFLDSVGKIYNIHGSGGNSVSSEDRSHPPKPEPRIKD